MDQVIGRINQNMSNVTLLYQELMSLDRFRCARKKQCNFVISGSQIRLFILTQYIESLDKWDTLTLLIEGAHEWLPFNEQVKILSVFAMKLSSIPSHLVYRYATAFFKMGKSCKLASHIISTICDYLMTATVHDGREIVEVAQLVGVESVPKNNILGIMLSLLQADYMPLVSYVKYFNDYKDSCEFMNVPCGHIKDRLICIVQLINLHDEIAVMTCLEAAIRFEDMDLSKIVIQRLLQINVAREAIMQRLLWPVDKHRYALIETNILGTERLLIENGQLLIQLGLHDKLPIIISRFPNLAKALLLNTNLEECIIPALRANDTELTEWSIRTLEVSEDANQIMANVIRERLNNNQFKEYCFLRPSPWLSLLDSDQPINPFFKIAITSDQDQLQSLMLFLSTYSEYPNDCKKLEVIVSAFTLSIEHAMMTNQGEALIKRLIKRRSLLSSKLSDAFIDYPLNDECFQRLLESGTANEWVMQQCYPDRCLYLQNIDNLSLTTQTRLFNVLSDCLDTITLSNNMDHCLAALQYCIQYKKHVESYGNVECENMGKLKKYVELLIKLENSIFVEKLIFSVGTIFGCIESLISSTDTVPLKFVTERNASMCFSLVLSKIDNDLSRIETFQKYAKNQISLTCGSLLSLSLLLISTCRVAIEGTLWDRLISLLIRFYKASSALLKHSINSHDVNERFISTISSHLTKSIYLLIPVAHQLDHQKMRELYEMGKLKKGNTQMSKRIDSKLAREAVKLPQLIYQIELFDCLVVKLSKWNAGICKYIYRSTARDFKIQLDQVEAALVNEANSSDDA